MTSIWDQHTCVALDVTADLGDLARYRHPGGTFVSVNVGYAPHSLSEAMNLLTAFRQKAAALPGACCVSTVEQVDAVLAAGGTAVTFDLEDSGPLDGDLANVARFVEQGVRSLVPAYNRANPAGSGCLDLVDHGLTTWGRELVAEMNRAGMIPDGSHSSVRTGLDLCSVSKRPVIYSHSCMRGVWEHPRNVTDDQARACADTGGVVGITGVGIFLGPNTPTLEAMRRHLEYAVDLVGIDHVGLSSDFSFDLVDFREEIAGSAELFDESYTRWGPIEWMEPETFVTVPDHLLAHGWRPDQVEAVVWGNFRRVAQLSWAPAGD